MTPLTWRTYRDQKQAPVPVAGAGPVRYRLERMAGFPDRDLEVGSFDGGVVLQAERQLEGGSELSASLLRDHTALIRPNVDLDLSYVIARPTRRPSRPSVYRLPKLVAPGVALTPLDARPGDKNLHVLSCEPLGRGAFKVEPGHVGPAAFRIRGADASFLIDYDPVQGVVYAEQGGDPVSADAPAELLVRQERTLRLELEGASHPILDQSGRVMAVAQRRPIQVTDERRLPAYGDDTKWHAVGQAHYDASPIPEGHKWIIDTDADPEDVRDAVRRTLPAGSIWRLKS